MEHGFQLYWKPWVDMPDAPAVCIVGDDAHFHYQPAVGTIWRVDGALKEPYDVIYLDRKLGRRERLGHIWAQYGPHLGEGGKLIFKSVFFGTRLKNPQARRADHANTNSVLRVVLSTLWAFRQRCSRHRGVTIRKIYVFPRQGTYLMSDDSLLLLRHMCRDGKSYSKAARCLRFLSKSRLLECFPWLWPFKYVIVSKV